VIAELEPLPETDALLDAVWTIRSEILSPSEKSHVLIRYLEGLLHKPGAPTLPAAQVTVAVPTARRSTPRVPAVGRDVGTAASHPRATTKERLP
jgi:hypothetical protein